MIIYFIFNTLILAITSFFCTQPQRAGVFSFETLSGRDHLTNVFTNVNNNIHSYNVSLKQNGTDYAILNFKPQFYYNDNDQFEQYVDAFTVNVTAGKLIMGYTFNYSYGSTGNISTGFARGKLIIDNFYFLKKTNIVDGYFEWDPTQISQLTYSFLMSIQTSTPVLPYEIKTVFQNMLNSHTGEENKLKQNVFLELNTLYKQDLKNYLNTQNLINSNNIQYSWKGNLVNYTNQVYYFSLYNNDTFKGLKYFFQFQLQGFMSKCNILPIQFDHSYGGVQQLIGLQFMKSGVLYGLTKGWFNTNLGTAWDHQIFQFYTGDLANCMDSANQFLPNTPLVGQCYWNNSQYNLQMSYYNTKSIFFNIPYTCTLSVNQKTIQNIGFSAVFIVDLILTNQYIDTKINYMGLLDPKFYPVDKYIITDEGLAIRYLTVLLRQLQGKRTYGAGFPTLYRKYPVLKITRDYLVLYDPSQV